MNVNIKNIYNKDIALPTFPESCQSIYVKYINCKFAPIKEPRFSHACLKLQKELSLCLKNTKNKKS
jgi:hypothetical protein